MDNKKYLVSAIVSVYNCERFIAGCLKDLERQTIADRLEIVVINSGSQENEEPIIRDFQKRFNNIVYIKTENRETIYQAWNKGIKAASGKYITNANTDDRHRKNAFEVMTNVLEQNKDVELVYADYITTETENGTFEEYMSEQCHSRPEFNQVQLLCGCFIGPQPMWRKKLHKQFGYFDETLKVVGDYEFWLRIAEKCYFKHINENLGLYLNNPNGAEHRDALLGYSEAEKVKKRYINRWLKEHSSDKKILKEATKQISQSLFCRGYDYFSANFFSLAKEVFLLSLACNWRNSKIYPRLVVCYFSPGTIQILRKITKRLKSKRKYLKNAESKRCNTNL